MVIILVGPSGSGKSTIERMIEARGVHRVISYTTRAMRTEDKDGVSYHFISPDRFEGLLAEGFFAEHTKYNGNYYGAARKDFSGSAVAVFELEGLKKIRENMPDIEIFSCYISVPEEVRVERMRKRGDEEAKIQERVLNDRKVFLEAHKMVDCVIDNDNLDKTVEHILAMAHHVQLKKAQ